MDIRTGILSTAQSLGIDPLDLATAISYETAGTFDPTKAGPTTQWGQHRGLIQFGEPQAQQYGVDWNDPVWSQLGPQGAVAGYLRDTGVKPGMGLLDIYSAINAGGVGRYNRSDANNGGAPGTVLDKVEKQMAGHRAKAAALLGDERQVMSTSSPATAGLSVTPSRGILNTMNEPEAPMQKEQPRGLLGRLFNMDAEDADQLRLNINGLLHNPNEGLQRGIEARMGERSEGRKEAKAQAAAQQQANKTIALMRQENAPSYLIAAAEAGQVGPAFQEFLKQRGGGQEPPSKIQELEFRARAAGYQPGTPEYQDFMAQGGSGPLVQNNIGAGEQTAGWKKIDEGFAPEWTSWVQGGGADSAKQIGQLRGVVDALASGQPLTGPAIGLQPDALQSIFQPEALDARQRVEEVVQRNLKAVLGAQFTQSEGDRLIARAFDQRLSPEQNAARLSALLQQMETAAKSKSAMVDYFGQNGTLQGFDAGAYIPRAADFEVLFDQLDERQGIAGQSGSEDKQRLRWNPETGDFE